MGAAGVAVVEGCEAAAASRVGATAVAATGDAAAAASSLGSVRGR